MTGDNLNNGEPDAVLVVTAALPNKAGLHARSAAMLIREAARFQAVITVRRGEKSARVRSLTELLRLGARQGDTLELAAGGPDAEEALRALTSLVQRGFGED